MNRSSYTITVVTPAAVFLVDNDVGLSVTNDAERVVAEINTEFPRRRIIYKDTTGSWDELVHNDGTFLRYAGLSPASREKFAAHLN